MTLERSLSLTRDLLYNAENLAFVLAACGLFLALSLGKTGLKRLARAREDGLWKLAAYATLAKLGLLALNLLWNIFDFFRLS